LDELIPGHALDNQFALGQRSGVRLAGIYRTKVGRLRIFWIASSAKQRAIVLFIGYRKEGGKKDAYTEFIRRLQAGEFDHYFGELKQQNPVKRKN
jgi:hypothetical protein